jgi:hypothetical protein
VVPGKWTFQTAKARNNSASVRPKAFNTPTQIDWFNAITSADRLQHASPAVGEIP